MRINLCFSRFQYWCLPVNPRGWKMQSAPMKQHTNILFMKYYLVTRPESCIYRQYEIIWERHCKISFYFFFCWLLIPYLWFVYNRHDAPRDFTEKYDHQNDNVLKNKHLLLMCYHKKENVWFFQPWLSSTSKNFVQVFIYFSNRFQWFLNTSNINRKRRRINLETPLS